MTNPKYCCIGVGLIIGAVIGVITLIAVGSTVVREYNLAKDFVPTECRLLKMDRSQGFRTCQYCYTTYTSTRRNGLKRRTSKQKCRPSSYPCVQMLVSYYDDYRVNRSATFFEDAVQTTKSILCSFYKCSQNVFDNEVFVDHMVQHYQRVGQHSFPCFYNKLQPGRVIGRKIHTYTEALHGMLWPGLITVGCIIGIIYFCCMARNDVKKSEDRTALTSTELMDSNVAANGIRDPNQAEMTPLKGPTGVNMGPIPGGYTGPPEPIPTQPYHPGGGQPMYPPVAPVGGFDPAYPPNQPSQYPPVQPGPYPPPQQPSQYPPPQPSQYPPPQPSQYPPPQPYQ